MVSTKVYQRERRKRRKELGLCTRCSNSAALGHTLCEEHLLEARARGWRLREQGVCTRCGNNPAVAARAHCEPCRQKHAENALREYQRRRLEGKCTICSQDAQLGRYCEKHWFTQLTHRHKWPPERAAELRQLIEDQGYVCPLSGRTLVLGENAALDHIIPKSRGGSDELSNLQWLDIYVNRAKSDLLPEEFVALVTDLYERLQT